MTHGAVLCIVREVDGRHPTATQLPLNGVAVSEGGFEAVVEIRHDGLRYASSAGVANIPRVVEQLEATGATVENAGLISEPLFPTSWYSNWPTTLPVRMP